MIGYDHHRSLSRNSGKIFRNHVIVNVKALQNTGQKLPLIRSRSRLGIYLVNPVKAKKFFQRIL